MNNKVLIIQLILTLFFNISDASFPTNNSLIIVEDTLKKETTLEYHQRMESMGFDITNCQCPDCQKFKGVKVKTNDFNKNGIANIGYRPTFNGQNLLLEVNIFGINKNLYNKVIKVYFLKFIRAEKKFRNLEHLRKQIKLDIKQAKK